MNSPVITRRYPQPWQPETESYDFDSKEKGKERLKGDAELKRREGLNSHAETIPKKEIHYEEVKSLSGNRDRGDKEGRTSASARPSANSSFPVTGEEVDPEQFLSAITTGDLGSGVGVNFLGRVETGAVRSPRIRPDISSPGRAKRLFGRILEFRAFNRDHKITTDERLYSELKKLGRNVVKQAIECAENGRGQRNFKSLEASYAEFLQKLDRYNARGHSENASAFLAARLHEDFVGDFRALRNFNTGMFGLGTLTPDELNEDKIIEEVLFAADEESRRNSVLKQMNQVLDVVNDGNFVDCKIVDELEAIYVNLINSHGANSAAAWRLKRIIDHVNAGNLIDHEVADELEAVYETIKEAPKSRITIIDRLHEATGPRSPAHIKFDFHISEYHKHIRHLNDSKALDSEGRQVEGDGVQESLNAQKREEIRCAMRKSIQDFFSGTNIDGKRTPFSLMFSLQRIARTQYVQSIARPQNLQTATDVVLLDVVTQLEHPDVQRHLDVLRRSSLAEERAIFREKTELLLDCKAELCARGAIKSATAVIEPLKALAKKIGTSAEWTSDENVTRECERILDSAINNVSYLKNARYWIFKLALSALDEAHKDKILHHLKDDTLKALKDADRFYGIGDLYEARIQRQALNLNTKIDAVAMERLKPQIEGFYSQIGLLRKPSVREDKNVFVATVIATYDKLKSLQDVLPDGLEKQKIEAEFCEVVREITIYDLDLNSRSPEELDVLKEIISNTPSDKKRRLKKQSLLEAIEGRRQGKPYIPMRETLITNPNSQNASKSNAHSAAVVPSAAITAPNKGPNDAVPAASTIVQRQSTLPAPRRFAGSKTEQNSQAANCLVM